MSIEEKGKLIANIMSSLKLACPDDRSFDEADTFFSLIFKTDEELEKIASLCL